jgi:hypothetical protein
MVINIKLTQYMARWKGHLVQLARIPGGHNQASRKSLGRMFQTPNNLGELVYTFPGIIRLVVYVCGVEVAPLMSVDGAEVAFGVVRESARFHKIV